jgi:hypothetical protein
MLKVIILAVFFLGLSFAALGIRILFFRNRKFPESSVGRNPELKKRGLNCASHDEIKCRRELGEHYSCGCHIGLSGKTDPGTSRS